MSWDGFIRAFINKVVPRSTEDWQPGDLAICIAEHWSERIQESPKKDDLLRVEHVCGDQRFLHFHGKPEGYHWVAIAFRKVKPDTDPAAQEAWVEQLHHFRRKETA